MLPATRCVPPVFCADVAMMIAEHCIAGINEGITWAGSAPFGA